MLEAQHIALAALYLTELSVRRRLTVAIFFTGDEVVGLGAPRGGAAIYDANRYLLRALLVRLGAVVTDFSILADESNELARALGKAAVQHDPVITLGDFSTGEADYVRSAVKRNGSLVFWRVAIKPGRPLALRRGSDGEIKAVKHSRDGAGIITSLTETDGLLEFPEDVTAIGSSERVGFPSYATFTG